MGKKGVGGWEWVTCRVLHSSGLTEVFTLITEKKTGRCSRGSTTIRALSSVLWNHSWVEATAPLPSVWLCSHHWGLEEQVGFPYLRPGGQRHELGGACIPENNLLPRKTHLDHGWERNCNGMSPLKFWCSLQQPVSLNLHLPSICGHLTLLKIAARNQWISFTSSPFLFLT